MMELIVGVRCGDWGISGKEDSDASGSGTGADRAQLGGRFAGVAEAEVAAGEEHHRGQALPAGAASPPLIDSVRLHEGRLGVLGRRRLAAPRLGRGGDSLLELDLEGCCRCLVGRGLGFPCHRFESEAGEAALELGAPPRCPVRFRLLLS